MYQMAFTFYYSIIINLTNVCYMITQVISYMLKLLRAILFIYILMQFTPRTACPVVQTRSTY
jgi:hypothetical protein